MKPKKLSPFISSRLQTSFATIFLAAGIPVIALAADQTWKGTTDALWSSTGNWSGAAVPGSGDLAIFDTLSTANLATTLGADTSVLGLKVVAPTAAVSIAVGNTLTIGTSGIDMSAATQNLTIASPLLLNTVQTWNVATGRTLTLSSTAVSTGSTGTVTKSGAGLLQLNAPILASGGTVLSGGTTNAATGNFVNLFGGPLTFENGAVLTNTLSASNTTAINSNIVVASGQSGTLNMGSRTQWGGNTTTYTLTGGGTFTFNAPSTIPRDDIYADMTAFTGTINFGGAGTARLFINGGKVGAGFTNSTLNLADSVTLQPQTNGTNNTINVNALTGTSATASLGGGTAGTAIYSVGASGTSTSFAGGIRGNAALTKVVSGTLTLTNATLLDYTGATTVTEGTLLINGVKSGAGATTVNGTSTKGILAGTGSLAGTTTVGVDGHLSPGDPAVAGGVGNLTLSNLTLSSGSYLDLQFGAGNDTVTIPNGGNLTIGSGVKVDVGGFGTAGTYPIINYTGVIATSGLTVVNGDPSKVYSFTSSGTVISLVISTSDPSNYWAVDGNGAWGTTGNWSKNLVPNAPSALALLGPYIAGVQDNTFSIAPTITLDSARTVGDLRFDDGGRFVPFTLVPGISGSLVMNNGVAPASISSNFGPHTISAPVAIGTQGLILDTTQPITVENNLTISGAISGASAAITKTGAGMVVLTGNNTYGGGTNISGGIVQIHDSSSLGAAAATATFNGGSLRIANDILTDARAYKISGANTANFDTNGFAYALTTAIAPLGGATGGLNKTGTGTLTLNAAQTYTGATSVNGGELIIGTGGSITGGSINTSTAASGSLLHVNNGGTITTTTGTLNPQTGGLFMDVTSGNVSFSGALVAMNTTSNGNSAPIRVSSGTLSAPSIQLGRTGQSITGVATAPVNTNLYMTGGAVTVSGDLIIGTSGGSTAPASTVVTRVDGGTLTLGGAVSIGLNNGGRWSIFDLNGGTLVNTGTAVDSGVVLGGPSAGKAAFLMRAGTATVERIQFGRGAVDGQGLLKITGGDLYVGSGGMPIVSTGVYTSEIRLAGGTLAAKADWSSPAPVTLGGGILKAADAGGVAHNITLSGAISGTSLFKTGLGTATLTGTNTYTGETAINEGTLAISGDNTAATGPVTVAASATLGGSGSVGGAVTVNGSIAPGASTGVLTVASATFNSGSSLAIDLNDAGSPTSDKLVTTGELNITSAQLKVLPNGGANQGTYVIAHYGTLTGTFNSLSGLPSGTTINYSYNNGVDSNNIALVVPATPYGTWANSFGSGFNATNNGTTQDPDNDGISNVLEFVLGGNPLTSSSNKLPTAAIVGSNYVFSFKRSDQSETEVGLGLKFQYGNDLTGWTSVTIGANNAASGSGVNIVENGAADDDITVTVPKGTNVKLFGRLQAVK